MPATNILSRLTRNRRTKNRQSIRRRTIRLTTTATETGGTITIPTQAPRETRALGRTPGRRIRAAAPTRPAARAAAPARLRTTVHRALAPLRVQAEATARIPAVPDRHRAARPGAPRRVDIQADPPAGLHRAAHLLLRTSPVDGPNSNCAADRVQLASGCARFFVC